MLGFLKNEREANPEIENLESLGFFLCDGICFLQALVLSKEYKERQAF